jgi:hypothetical protein
MLGLMTYLSLITVIEASVGTILPLSWESLTEATSSDRRSAGSSCSTRSQRWQRSGCHRANRRIDSIEEIMNS